MTDADTEAGRGEQIQGGTQEDWEQAIAEARESENPDLRWWADAAEGLLDEVMRLRQSDPGGEPVAEKKLAVILDKIGLDPTIDAPDDLPMEVVEGDVPTELASDLLDLWSAVAAPTDEAPESLDGRAYLTEGHDGELPPVEEGERGERLGQGVGWWTRCGNFLETVGASRPEDHAWVEEARWLLDHFPRRASVYDRASEARGRQ